MRIVSAIVIVVFLSVFFKNTDQVLAKRKLTITDGVLYESRVLVPMRAIFEELGATVKWDGSTKRVTAVKGETTIELGMNEMWATVNGEHIPLDVHTQINDGITVVPLRFVGETLGAKVGWDNKNQIASVIIEDKEVNITINTWITVVDGNGSISNQPANKDTSNSTDKWSVYGKTIKKGMTPNQVMQLLGRPNNYSQNSKEEILMYSKTLPAAIWEYYRDGIFVDYWINFWSGEVFYVKDFTSTFD